MSVKKNSGCSLEEARETFFGAFPDSPYLIDTLEYGRVRVRLPAGRGAIRPGGTVSGPELMTLSDATAWIAVFSVAGAELMAVTSNLSIDFLRRPDGSSDLLADGEVLKAGRRLCVVDTHIRRASDEALVARATVNYMLP